MLLADLGGTNLRFGISEIGIPSISQEYTTTWEKCETLTNGVKLALSSFKLDVDRIGSATVAYAGPVEPGKNHFKFTNAKSEFSLSELSEILEVEQSKIHVINDFFGQALYIDDLVSNYDDVAIHPDIEVLHPGGRNKAGAVAIIGPGTGLGVAGMYPSNTHHAARIGLPIVIPGEGGSIHLGAREKSLNSLLPFFPKATHWYRTQTDAKDLTATNRLEDALSGQGLSIIYCALALRDGKNLKDFDADLFMGAGEISKNAKTRVDSRAVEAFEIFFDVLAMACSSIALQYLAYGGVFILGGVVQKNLDILDSGRFAERFFDTWGYRELLRGIPVYVVKNSTSGLEGARLYSQKFVEID